MATNLLSVAANPAFEAASIFPPLVVSSMSRGASPSSRCARGEACRMARVADSSPPSLMTQTV